MGKFELPQHVVVSFDDVNLVLQSFSSTNYVALPGYVGRELRGAPMGDALSGAILRLFKFSREHGTTADAHGYEGTCTKLVQLHGHPLLVFDVSFRDDLRLFCTWPKTSPLGLDDVQQWASHVMNERYRVGTMTIEQSDVNVFVGLKTQWTHRSLRLTPNFTDDYALDCQRLKPWHSWAPKSQLKSVVIGMLCRAWFQSNEPIARKGAFRQVFQLLKNVGYPHPYLKTVALKWARSWKPLGVACLTNVSDICEALHAESA